MGNLIYTCIHPYIQSNKSYIKLDKPDIHNPDIHNPDIYNAITIKKNNIYLRNYIDYTNDKHMDYMKNFPISNMNKLFNRHPSLLIYINIYSNLTISEEDEEVFN